MTTVTSGRRMSAQLDLDYRAPDTFWREFDGAQVWKNELRDDRGTIKLTSYAIVWSPLTARQKTSLCSDSGMQTPSCPQYGKRRQAKINNELKSRLMNDCLADAIIYLGDDGDMIRDSVRKALEAINDDRASRSLPAAIISESLGSKIIADAVDPDDNAVSAAARNSIGGTRVIYMAANQIPLLDLDRGTVTGALGGGSVLDVLKRAIALPEGPEALSAIQAVAFTDPNDLLSYELTDVRSPDANVRITIAPVVFGFIANPFTAHTAYLDNERVWQYIACGSSLECAR